MTPSTPSMASAAEVSIETMRAWACGERSTWTCSMPGMIMSPAYLRRPDTLLGVSMRRTFLPMKSPCSASISASAVAGRRPFCTSRASSTASKIFW